MSMPPDNRFAARWFAFGMHFFALGVVGSIAVVAVAALSQMKVLGLVTLALAAAGTLVCMIGVRLYNAPAWRALRGHVASIGDSMRGAAEAIGEPRQVAYSRSSLPTGVAQGTRVEPGMAKVAWPV